MNEQIIIKAIRERILIQEYFNQNHLITDVEFTPANGSDKYDATWVEMDTNCDIVIDVIAEIKVRTYPMTTYGTWLIQKDKYDFLMAQKQAKKLYINIHPDGFQIWDLSEMAEPVWLTSLLPQNNQEEYMIEKINGDVNSNDAEKIMMKLEIYTALNEAKIIYNNSFTA